MQDTMGGLKVRISRTRHELAQLMDGEGNVGASCGQVDETTNEPAIGRGIG